MRNLIFLAWLIVGRTSLKVMSKIQLSCDKLRTGNVEKVAEVSCLPEDSSLPARMGKDAAATTMP